MKASIKYWIAIVLTVSVLASDLASAQVQIQGPNSADVYSGIVYGPIDETDTLWRIASRYKQNSEFSVYQTMLAIYQLNPQAFENNNFNTMVNGATLQLPSDEYIGRMSMQQARAKAIADDRAFGRQNSVQPESVIEDVANATAAQSVPLVNQEDLSSTKQELQRELSALNRQQSNQFDEVKSQVSASIDSVQALLDENRKLYDRLDQVNQDVADLRNRVEVDIQSQIDQQLTLQKEIIELVKQSEQRQSEQAPSSIFNTLKSPMMIITLSSILTIGILVLFGLWLLRKPKSDLATEQALAPNADPLEIVDDELVIGEADDDADDLLAALSQDGDDEDDILSADLEDGLDELGVGEHVVDTSVNELTDSADDELTDNLLEDVDEMLVPDSDDLDLDEAAGDLEPEMAAEADESSKRATVPDEDISFDPEAIDLDADEFENQEIDLSPPSEPEAENEESSTDSPAPESSQSSEPAVAASANKLAGGPEQAGVELPDTSSDAIDEESLQNMEDSINEITEEFETLSNEIMEDFENGVGDEDEPDAVLVPAEPAGEEKTAQSDANDADDNELDELLEQFSEAPTQAIEDPINENIDEEAISSSDPTDELLDEADTTTELADEIAAELAEDAEEEELEALLDELGGDVVESGAVDEQSPDLETSAETLADISADTPAEVSQDAAESHDATENETSVSSDSDALLDEIPSFNELADTKPVSDLDDASTDEDSTGEDSTDEDSTDEESTAVDARDAANTEPVIDTQQLEQTDELTTLNEQSAEDDILADLPDLDDWLNEENVDGEPIVNAIQADHDSELNILADIESADFEDLLAEIDEENTDLADELKALESEIAQDSQPSELKNAGLDIDTLMQDESVEAEVIEDFVDVDDLLSETEALSPKEDDELALNLDESLSHMPTNKDAEDTDAFAMFDADGDVFTEQASNLDLAQVYIDMDDAPAAVELLEEVVAKGNDKQILEASELLESIKK